MICFFFTTDTQRVECCILLLLYRVGFAFFCADLNESPTDDATDASTSSPQKRRLVIDTAHESSGTSTEVMGSSTSETEIASDWTEFASLSSSRKLQETSRATQVSRPAIAILYGSFYYKF